MQSFWIIFTYFPIEIHTRQKDNRNINIGVITVKNVEKSSGNNSLVTHGDSRVCCLILSDFEKAAKQAKKGGHHYVVLSINEQRNGLYKKCKCKTEGRRECAQIKIYMHTRQTLVYLYVCMYVCFYVCLSRCLCVGAWCEYLEIQVRFA